MKKSGIQYEKKFFLSTKHLKSIIIFCSHKSNKNLSSSILIKQITNYQDTIFQYNCNVQTHTTIHRYNLCILSLKCWASPWSHLDSTRWSMVLLNSAHKSLDFSRIWLLLWSHFCQLVFFCLKAVGLGSKNSIPRHQLKILNKKTGSIIQLKLNLKFS